MKYFLGKVFLKWLRLWFELKNWLGQTKTVIDTIHTHDVHVSLSDFTQDCNHAVFEHTFHVASFDCMKKASLTCKRLLRWPTMSLAVITHASVEHQCFVRSGLSTTKASPKRDEKKQLFPSSLLSSPSGSLSSPNAQSESFFFFYHWLLL